MNKKEKHDYFCFDRFLQVMNTEYEKELIELEKKYYKKELSSKDFDNEWNKLVEKIIKDNNAQ